MMGLPSLQLIHAVGLAVVVYCLCMSLRVRAAKEEIRDFRFISYDDLLPTIARFSEIGVVSYSQLLFDIPRYQVLVGARDHLFRLSLEGLQKYEDAHWPSSQTTIDVCQQKGQSEEDCRNYIRILLARNGKVFTCGTNAFSPKCSWREIENLNTVTEESSGIGKCPYSPHQNVTALIASSGDYYVGSAVDFSARDPAIYRFEGNVPGLRTVQYDHKWLSEPNFVASYEIANFTYFFFRETAVEYINCGKTIYSRIARVCKNDAGGQYLLKDNWTTFLKARLNCSVPGEFPFYYNEIQSIFYLEQDNILYATFTTPVNSIVGSAICAFNMSSIDRTFRGPFKHQSSRSSAWEKHSGHHAAHRHFQCETPSNSKHSLDSEKYQIMDESVQPTMHTPLATVELERYSHIVVDIVSTQHHEAIHVIFVATAEGIIKKMMVLPRTQQTCLLEVLRLFPGNHSQPIKLLKILKDTNSLYVGTDMSVMRIPVERCSRFATKRACLNAMDPYCGWNSHQQLCATAPHRNPLSSFWQQSFPACPVLNEPVDGKWGLWGPWFECSHMGDASSGSRCNCRSRKCNNPSPAYGGQECEGINLQVTNCTQNGQWTEWSAWSACSQTCGLAVKTRRRSCGNPEPAYGGRTCVGPDRDEIYCTSNPPCPAPTVPSIDGRWSEWSAWDDCSAPCGAGFQTRRRRCDNPQAQNGGRECLGCNMDYRICNIAPCNEQRKSTVWTPWLRGNSSKDGYYELRFRFTCKANVPDSKFIRVGNMKKEERFCLEDGRNCFSSEFINSDGDWSEWSTWTECSSRCGGGIRFRERSCDSPRPSGSGSDCLGESRMESTCNTHPCSSTHAPNWSAWSACSVTCGKGLRSRTRTCLHATNHPPEDIIHLSTADDTDDLEIEDGSSECAGTLTEEEPCMQEACQTETNDLEGWDEWSMWSTCDSQGYMHRKRECLEADAGTPVCQGTDRQTRMCIDDQDNELSQLASIGGYSSSGIEVGHMVAACFVCFFLGALLAGGAMYYMLSRRQRRRQVPSNKHFIRTTPNVYTQPEDCFPKNNFCSGTLTKNKGIPLAKEATIKRNGQTHKPLSMSSDMFS